MPVTIKWPNDLLVHGKKIGGVLTERVPAGHLIIGIGVNIDLDLEKIFETAVRVAEMSGIPIPEKAPLLGPEVFIHRSGIHQDGAIKTSKEEKGAYRPIDPAWIGRAGDEECEFTSQSGSAALRRIILETGRSISDQEARILQPALKAVSENRGVLSQEELAAVYDAFKELEKRKPEIEVADMAALAENVISTRGQRTWELKNIQATAGTVATQTAMIILIRDGREFKGVAMGDGPVDAAFEAIRQITGVDCKLESYQIKPVTKGKAAQGEATVVLSLNGLQCEGHNAHTDIVVASAKAYLHALNRLLRGEVNGAKSS